MFIFCYKPTHTKGFHRLAQVALLMALIVGLSLAFPMPAHAAPAFQATFDCIVISEIPQAECAALVALYNSTNGAGWSNNDNWLTSYTPCGGQGFSSWYGVRCEGNSVTQLHLGINQLSGSIPLALGNLTNLNALYLHNNQLSGGIPPTLGNLTNLQWLYLLNNQLSGGIPPTLGNLTNLNVLELHNNQLSGAIPPTLGNLTNLNALYLHNNQLSGAIPPTLGNLTNLYVLELHHNQLSGAIPPTLGNLTNLYVLELHHNQLSGTLPPALGALSNLQELYLQNNQLSGAIPPTLGNLTNLQQLELYANQLSDSIPAQLGNLPNLQVLSLFNNQLSGPIPPELGNLTTVRTLFLHNNQLSGPIPSELGNLTDLQWLYLFNNQLSGPIPPELGNLANLQWLFLPNNQLSGSIPATLCMPSLTTANFGYNQLAASDPCLATIDPDWAQTQTVPPTHVQAQALANQPVQLTWTPITYTADGGYYIVLDAPTASGPYTVVGQTADKTASGITLAPLGPGTHHLVVRTFTPQHGAQQNDLTSDNSAAVVVVLNTPPLAASGMVTATQGSVLSIHLQVTDVDSDPLSYALMNLPAHGSLNGSAPNLVYTPATGFTGVDSFTYKANDGKTDSNLATITIQVVAAPPPVNTPPVAHSQTVTTTQGSQIALTLSASDGEGDGLTYQVIRPPVHGSLGGIAPALVYTPTPGYNGTDSFTFQVSDGDLISALVTVQINVTTQPNRPPSAQDDAFTVTRNSQGNALAVLSNDHDLDGDGLTLVAVAAPLNGAAQIVNGQVRYTPAAEFVGADRFSYSVSDGKATVVATISVTVAAAAQVAAQAIYLPVVQR